jgi:hypothetical protein
VIWRRRRAAGEPVRWISGLSVSRARRSALVWIPLAVLAVPIAALLERGVLEKAVPALKVVLTGKSLAVWNGEVPYFALHRFVGLLDPRILGVATLVALLACASWALWRSPREAALPLAVVVSVALLFALSFRLRRDGQLFYFKDLSFLAPILVTLAVVGLADLAARGAGAPTKGVAIAGLATLTAMFAINVDRELENTHEQGTRDILALKAWGRQLPARDSIRIDIPPTGVQLWAYNMLSRHPLSSTAPIPTFFPVAPRSRKADYVLIERAQPRPADVQGGPLLENTSFRLYRMMRSVPGPDLSSRRMIEPYRNISIT